MFPLLKSRSFVAYLAFPVAFCIAGILWIAQPIAHAQDQPDALGSISGTVTNAQGLPLPNVTVWREFHTDPSESRSVTTDEQGVYHFPSIYSGGYKLHFEDPTGVYAASYYPDALFSEDAQTVVVNGNHVSGIDMALVLGGSISVTIQSAAPLTRTVVSVYLFRENTQRHWESYRYVSWNLDRNATRLAGLAEGSYRLCADIRVDPYVAEGYECYDDILPDTEGLLPPNAKDVVVQAGNDTSITIAFGNFTQLEGFVRAPNGDPLGGINVLAQIGDQNAGYRTSTNVNGYFRFGYLRSASYKLIYNDDYIPNNYLPSFYPNTLYRKDAESLAITPNSHYSLSISLQPEAHIIGKIMSPNNAPFGGYSIAVYSQRADGSWQNSPPCEDVILCNSYQKVEFDSATGTYTVTQLLPGHYRIYASTTIDIYGNYVSLEGFYGGTSLEDADDIPVDVGQIAKDINISLGEHDFNGSISGVVTAGNVLQPGLVVGLFDQYRTGLPNVYTHTDTQGRYRFDGLYAGSYTVGVYDPAGVYATTFYSSSENAESIYLVTVPITGTVDHINVTLTPGGTIRGRVHTPPDILPASYQIGVIREGGSIAYKEPFIDVRTDKDGNYTVTGLSSGSFVVFALSPEPYPSSGFSVLRFHPGASDQFTAIPVKVEASEEQTGIDIYFTFAPSSFLPQLDARGAVE